MTMQKNCLLIKNGLKKTVNEIVSDKVKKSVSSGKKNLWIAAGVVAVGILALVAKSFKYPDKTKH